MYNTPYFFPGVSSAANVASKASILSKLNLGTILTNASKTLNVINQAIPLYYQAKPVISNLKSLTKITKEFSNKSNNTVSKKQESTENNTISNTSNIKEQKKEESSIPNPSFFL